LIFNLVGVVMVLCVADRGVSPAGAGRAGSADLGALAGSNIVGRMLGNPRARCRVPELGRRV
jgi:hypothetical protein